MIKMNFVLLVMMITSVIICVKSLSCLDSRTGKCPDKGIVESQCPLGVTKDACNLCWICAKGFKESCGGYFNFGTCAIGLRCSNPPEEARRDWNLSLGICCRTSQVVQNNPIELTCTGVIVNQCSLETECKKGSGEICGGPGGIYGTCGTNLICLPVGNDATYDRNSTCIPLTDILLKRSLNG